MTRSIILKFFFHHIISWIIYLLMKICLFHLLFFWVPLLPVELTTIKMLPHFFFLGVHKRNSREQSSTRTWAHFSILVSFFVRKRTKIRRKEVGSSDGASCLKILFFAFHPDKFQRKNIFIHLPMNRLKFNEGEGKSFVFMLSFVLQLHFFFCFGVLFFIHLV